MKINTRIVAVILLGYCAGFATPVLAQKKNRLKKGPNISVNISAKKDNTRNTYLNLGLLTHIYRMQGVGINVLSSVVQSDMAGFQVSGLASITGRHASGIQLGGIANVAGANASGFMLGGLMNVAGNQANGIQVSGLGNIAGRTSRGIAISGLINLAGDKAQGMQISGLANIAGKSQSGLAISGLMNVSAGKLDGAQAAGILNISGGDTKGVQAGGIGNVGVNVNGVQVSGISNIAAGKMKGVQLALGNYAEEVSGTQIGLLNLCRGQVKGVQIGIVNHSKDTTAHKIGLVNINPQTRVQMLVFGGNTSKFNAAVRFKNKHTYTMLGLGTHYLDLNDKFSGCVSYRAGLYYPIAKNLEISGELGYSHIENFENKNAEIPERMYSLQARVNLEYHIQPKFGIFASGGYSMTRYYNKNKFYEKKAIVEVGVILF